MTTPTEKAKIVELRPNIYQIRAERPGSHVYLIKGRAKNVLIDTGMAANFPNLKERLAEVGLKPSDILVFGHTHRGFIDRASHAVNTGSWVLEGDKTEHNYVEITDQSYDLKSWPVSDEVRMRRETLGTAFIPRKLSTYEALKAAKRARQAIFLTT